MQVKTEQIRRQQEILQAFGFYHGKLDGIWGPQTIAAKKKYEADKRFTPGIPNNGMPFADRPPYPAGMTLDQRTGLLQHPILETAERVARQPDGALIQPEESNPEE